MEIIWHGTASIEISSKDDRILFDPFFPFKGSVTEVSDDEFDGFTDILITHGHFDHIGSLPLICGRNPESKIYCTCAPRKTLRKKGVSEDSIHLLGINDVIEIGCFRITAHHAKHAVLPKASAKRISYILRSPYRLNLFRFLREHLSCPEKDESLLYEIEADGKRVFLLGSLNLREEIEYPTGCDLLILPYNGWEDNLPPAQSVIQRLKPKRVVLDHYDDTFPPLTMPLDLDPIIEWGGGTIEPLQLRTPVYV